MKAGEAQLRAALDAPGRYRLFLFHGADEAGGRAHAARIGQAAGQGAERIDLDGAVLRGDPGRLVDEAQSLSLFGDKRWVRVSGAGEESLGAVELLLEAAAETCPVVVLAPGVKPTGKLVKLGVTSPHVLSFACYLPEGGRADALAAQIAATLGLRPQGRAAQRLAIASGGDRAVMTRELEKLALYLDASPERPATLDDAALDAVGADFGESEIGAAVAAVLEGDARALAQEMARLDAGGASPIPWLRALERRLAALAAMRGEVDNGSPAADVVKRHRIHFREADATIAALRRWAPAAIAAAQARVRGAQLESMGAIVAAEHAALGLTLGARSARR